ncbi:MAG: hypothetical protein LWW87_12695 [Geobacteraceae bacterium]|nr:hypothetical protein [Geobacteraceae bacterium]
MTTVRHLYWFLHMLLASLFFILTGDALAAQTSSNSMHSGQLPTTNQTLSQQIAPVLQVAVEVPTRTINYRDPYVLMGKVKLLPGISIKNGVMFFKINGTPIKKGYTYTTVTNAPVAPDGTGVWPQGNYAYIDHVHPGINTVEAEFVGTGQNNERLAGKGVGTLMVQPAPTILKMTSFTTSKVGSLDFWTIKGSVLIPKSTGDILVSEGTVYCYINGNLGPTSGAVHGYGSSGFELRSNWTNTPYRTVERIIVRYEGSNLYKQSFLTGQIEYYDGPRLQGLNASH